MPQTSEDSLLSFLKDLKCCIGFCLAVNIDVAAHRVFDFYRPHVMENP